MNVEARIKALEEELERLLESDLGADLKEARVNFLIGTININRGMVGLPKINPIKIKNFDPEED